MSLSNSEPPGAPPAVSFPAPNPSDGPTASRRTFSPRVIRVLLAVILIGGTGWWWYYSTRPGTRLRRGQAAARENDVVHAEQYAELLKDAGDDDGYHLLMGEVALIQNKWERALGHLAQVKPDGPHHIEAAVLTARSLISLRQPKDAQRVLMYVITERPDHADAHRYLATIYYDQGDLNRALPHLQEVTKLDSKDAKPWRLMGLVHTNRDEYEQAVEAYRKSLQLDPHPPDEAEVRVELAVCLVKLRKEDEVLRELAGIETEAAQAARAEAMIAQGQEAEAIALLDQGLKDHPTYGGFLRLRGERYLSAGQPEKAVPLLKKLVEQVPDDFRGRTQLAIAYESLNPPHEKEAQEQRDKAKEIVSTIEKINAKQLLAMENTWDPAVRLEIADLCDKIQRPKEAAMWRRAAEAAQNSR